MTQSAELQTDNTETLNEADSAPATGENLEENTNFDSSGDESENVSNESAAEEEKKAEEPANYTKRINQIHFEKMQAIRKKEELEARIAELESQSSDKQRPVIPDLPDPYDDDFDKRIAEREKAIADAARYDANQQIMQSQQEDLQRAALAKQQEDLVKAVTSYSERAGKLNVSDSELQVAGQTVQALGISAEIASHILTDDQGPLLTVFLAKNPSELEKINGMTALKGAIYLETHIKPKAGKQGIKPPPPPDTLDGGGMSPKIEGPEGVTYT